jgi:hypothetical protein
VTWITSNLGITRHLWCLQAAVEAAAGSPLKGGAGGAGGWVGWVVGHCCHVVGEYELCQPDHAAACSSCQSSSGCMLAKFSSLTRRLASLLPPMAPGPPTTLCLTRYLCLTPHSIPYCAPHTSAGGPGSQLATLLGAWGAGAGEAGSITANGPPSDTRQVADNKAGVSCPLVMTSCLMSPLNDVGLQKILKAYRTKRLPSLSLIIFQGLAKEFRVKK